MVEAYTASWIEIRLYREVKKRSILSKPIRLRGLKLLLSVQDGQ